MTIRWRSDFDKHCVVSSFTRRKWQKHMPGEGEDWNIYWASVLTVRNMFQPDSGIRLEPHQMVSRSHRGSTPC